MTEKPLSEKTALVYIHDFSKDEHEKKVPKDYVRVIAWSYHREAVCRLKKEIEKFGTDEGWDSYIHKTQIQDLIEEVFGEVKP